MISRMLIAVLVFGLVMVLCVACSDESDPVQPTGESADDYIKGLPDWEEFSPPLPDDDLAGETTRALEWGEDDPSARYICSVTEHDLTQTPEDIVTFNAGADILWLGGLIQGSTYIGGIGTMEELPIRQRAPVTLVVNLLAEDVSRTVENPDAASVQSALGELIENAEQSGLQWSSSTYFNREEVYTFDQAALDIGMSARYLGTSVRGQLHFDTSVETNTIAAVFKQQMFTVSMVQPQTPGNLFSDAFTPELLQEQIDLGRLGPDNPPVYVSQIVYGRIMMMTITSSVERDSLFMALEATNRAVGASGEVSGDFTSVLQRSQIKVVTIGGSEESALALLRSGHLADYFATESPLTAASPIAYKLRHLPDNTLARAAETTSYELRECTATETVLFSDESEVGWQISLEGDLGGVMHIWRPTSENIAMSQEISNPPGNNVNVGSRLTLLGADTGLPFDFSIETLEPGATFTHNDTEFNSWTYPALSPGDADNYQQDDFLIRILAVDPGHEVVGIGVNIGNNGSTNGEALLIYDPDDHLIADFTENLPVSNGYRYCGVLDGWPLGAYKYLEDDGGDDIVLGTLFFGVRPTP